MSMATLLCRMVSWPRVGPTRTSLKGFLFNAAGRLPALSTATVASTSFLLAIPVIWPRSLIRLRSAGAEYNLPSRMMPSLRVNSPSGVFWPVKAPNRAAPLLLKPKSTVLPSVPKPADFRSQVVAGDVVIVAGHQHLGHLLLALLADPRLDFLVTQEEAPRPPRGARAPTTPTARRGNPRSSRPRAPRRQGGKAACGRGCWPECGIPECRCG